MQTTEPSGRLKTTNHGTLPPIELRTHMHPALNRLADAVQERNAGEAATNYSRMHHRHARSHTRK